MIILTVIIVVILYIHIVFQHKTSNDMEVFEMCLPNKAVLEDVCNLKQPVLFEHDDSMILSCSPNLLPCAFNVRLTNSKKTTLKKANVLFEKGGIASMKNTEYLNETRAIRHFKSIDATLRPALVATTIHDILFGSVDYTTQLQYHTSSRNYFVVTRGSITVKLTPPKNSTFIHETKRYATNEYVSTMDPWTSKKTKFINVKAKVGQILYIPAYWWYSIKLEKDACVCSLQYKTYLNILATGQDVLLGLYQSYNKPKKLNKIV